MISAASCLCRASSRLRAAWSSASVSASCSFPAAASRLCILCGCASTAACFQLICVGHNSYFAFRGHAFCRLLYACSLPLLASVFSMCILFGLQYLNPQRLHSRERCLLCSLGLLVLVKLGLHSSDLARQWFGGGGVVSCEVLCCRRSELVVVRLLRSHELPLQSLCILHACRGAQWVVRAAALCARSSASAMSKRSGWLQRACSLAVRCDQSLGKVDRRSVNTNVE